MNWLCKSCKILSVFLALAGRPVTNIGAAAAPGWSRSSKVKSGPRSVPRGVQWPLQLRVKRSLVAQPVAALMLQRSATVSRGRSKIEQFRARLVGQQLLAESATVYEEQIGLASVEKVYPSRSISRGSRGNGPSGNVSQQRRKNEAPNGDIHTLSPLVEMSTCFNTIFGQWFLTDKCRLMCHQRTWKLMKLKSPVASIAALPKLVLAHLLSQKKGDQSIAEKYTAGSTQYRTISSQNDHKKWYSFFQTRLQSIYLAYISNKTLREINLHQYKDYYLSAD
ncbi:MAG: hypothetical protein EZS28_022449 [Streblomastix strix]|uniref:PH domain-containing protein n=1 Tax=Streblomastix strix TaxID=222440 RepID=A0A5J4VHE7_9EUKA|nr:MAG: hypothetical protein EZS28_022449 [Streblomastix strix]